MENETLTKLVNAFSLFPEVEAVALSGSKTSPVNDENSDYDLYIYQNAPLAREKRKAMLESLGLSSIIGGSPFEEGDEAKDDKDYFDMMYRSLEWTEKEIDDVWFKHSARLGYTTAFLYNLKTSKILYDRSGKLAALLEPLNGPYPEELKKNIIKLNLYTMDSDTEAPFIKQIELAVKRGDLISQNHRLTALLSSYFDVLFAFNEALHPGEKKLGKYVPMFCEKLPENYEEEMTQTLLSHDEDLVINARKLLKHLHELVD